MPPSWTNTAAVDALEPFVEADEQKDANKESNSVTPPSKQRPNEYVLSASEERWQEIYAKYPHFPKREEFSDLNKAPAEALIRFPGKLESYLASLLLKDPRDAIMLSLVANICCTTLPLQVCLWFHPSHKLGIVAFAFNFAVWAKRYILMLHYAEHRVVFQHWITRQFVVNCMCVLFGFPPGMYYLHHLIMHHVGNNVWGDDMSSTEAYQRDSIWHCLMYIGRQARTVISLPYWAYKKGRYEMSAISLAGFLTWWALVFNLRQFNSHFVTYVFICPVFFAWFVLMFGNFCQHIFVHPSAGTCPSLHGYAYNCAIAYQSINHLDNREAFQDGYHVTHHINSRIHWTEHIEHFLTHLETYVEHNTLVINGLGIADVGCLVMIGRLDIVAKHVVQFTKEKQPQEAIIADLKARMQPIVREKKMEN